MFVSNTKAHITIIITSLLLCACNFSFIKTSPETKPTQPTANTPAIEQEKTAKQEPQVPQQNQANEDKKPTLSPPQADDLWQEIAASLHLERELQHPSVRDKINWYQSNQDYLNRVTERARPYLHYIVQELKARDMPVELALLPIIESAYQPFARSPRRASGIWQFMPATGKQFGLQQNWWYDGRRDIVASTDAALQYLQSLNQKFDGDWSLTLAAYNAGPGKINRALKRNRQIGKPTDYWSLTLPRETRRYVPNLMAIAEIVAHPQRYNIQLQAIANKAYFTAVDIKSQLDLATVAELTKLDMDTIYRLNPGFNSWATAPDGPHRLILPVELAESFEQNLNKLPTEQRMGWQRHKIRSGETLSHIATKYTTNVHALKESNRLKNNRIRAGHYLLIPVAKKPLQTYTLSQESRKYKGLKRSQDGQDFIYRIKRGDTLWDISRHYGISVAQLCRWNGIQRKTTLRLGQKLHIKINPSDETTALFKTAVLDTQSGLYKILYEVQDGDSLWRISRHFGVSIQQLRNWNNLTSGRFLQPGQSINVYTQKKPTGV